MKKSYQESSNHARADHAFRANIGSRIRDARVKRGMSMQEIADRGGPSVTTQHLIESGAINAKIGTVQALADVIGIRPAVFISDDAEDLGKIVAIINASDADELDLIRREIHEMQGDE